TVFRSIDSFRGDAKLGTWIYRVATNHCRNRLKYLGRRARHRRTPFDDEAERLDDGGGTSAHIPRPDAVVEGRQTEALVQRALLMLTDEQRTLVVLRDVEGMRYDEIMAITGLPEGTVKSKLHRARLALSAALRTKEGRRCCIRTKQETASATPSKRSCHPRNEQPSRGPSRRTPRWPRSTATSARPSPARGRCGAWRCTP